jgi:hypothetical protein
MHFFSKLLGKEKDCFPTSSIKSMGNRAWANFLLYNIDLKPKKLRNI